MATKEKMQEHIDQLQAQNKSLLNENEELRAKLENTSGELSQLARGEDVEEKKPVCPQDVFEAPVKDDDGNDVVRKFRFVAPVFIFKGQKITASDALADTPIREELAASKSGVLQVVE